MSESTIGIKIANGEYYPILQDGVKGKKRLVLTTVNDDQDSVQIDMYKGAGDSIENASYVGSLIIEDIALAMSGEPEIELILGVDEEGNLNAEASDLKSGEKRSLSVSLDSVSAAQSYDLPDFEISNHGEDNFFDDSFNDDFPDTDDEFTQITDSPENELSYEEKHRLTDDAQEEQEENKKERKVHPLLLLAFILAGLAIIALVVILLVRNFAGEPVPPLQAEVPPAVTAPEKTDEAVKAPPVEKKPEAPAVVVQAPEPVQEKPPIIAEPSAAGGFWYLIKQGDTLWDLSNSFYRTPWLYGKIARENKIANPNRIYWGFRIYIPKQ